MLVDINTICFSIGAHVNATPVGVNPKPQRSPGNAGLRRRHAPTSGSSLSGLSQGLASAGTKNTLAGSELPTRSVRSQSRFG